LAQWQIDVVRDDQGVAVVRHTEPGDRPVLPGPVRLGQVEQRPRQAPVARASADQCKIVIKSFFVVLQLNGQLLARRHGLIRCAAPGVVDAELSGADP
jgi:hypothetical protein